MIEVQNDQERHAFCTNGWMADPSDSMLVQFLSLMKHGLGSHSVILQTVNFYSLSRLCVFCQKLMCALFYDRYSTRVSDLSPY